MISAIEAIWAFHEPEYRARNIIEANPPRHVPERASLNSAGITTNAPETASMGQIAAKTVIDQIEGNGEYIAQIATEPDLWCRPRPNRFRLCW
jgi:hypothetical protein